MNLHVATRLIAFSYRSMIQTKKDEWIEVELPLDRFVATRFGRQVRNIGPVEPQDVVGLGFLLGDKRSGPFEMEVDWIKVVRAGNN